MSVNNKTGAVSLSAGDVGAVAKTGDTMTGDLTLSGDARYIRYSSGVRDGVPIAFYAGADAGSGVVIGDGGRTIIGGGESAPHLRTALTSEDASEEMHVAADGAVYIHSNCNNIASRKTYTFAANGSLTVPGAISATGFSTSLGAVPPWKLLWTNTTPTTAITTKTLTVSGLSSYNVFIIITRVTIRTEIYSSDIAYVPGTGATVARLRLIGDGGITNTIRDLTFTKSNNRVVIGDGQAHRMDSNTITASEYAIPVYIIGIKI